MNMNRSQNSCRLLATSLALVALCLTSPGARAARTLGLGEIESALAASFSPDPAQGSVQVAAAGRVEVAFSPGAGAEALVVKVIDAATTEIRMLAYSFTSAAVTAALLRAKHRGVDVALVVDAKNNLSEDRSGKARAALGALANAGIRVRTISVYSIHHDKVICVDGRTVETGSYNFTEAAAHRNSENVLVMWGNPPLAAVYLRHWAHNWAQGAEYQPGY
ncbi:MULTISPECIES: phospholipase D family nuclease [Cupriavidus]